MMRMSLGRTATTVAFVVPVLVSGLVSLVGCSGGGDSGGGSGGSTTGTGGATTGSGGSTGSGGATTGTGGSTTGTGGATGTGGSTTGTGGSAPDGGADMGGGTGGASGLHGGTSGKYICPAGGNYTGMTPALGGAANTITRANAQNGEGPVWVPSLMTFLYTSKIPGDDNTRQIWKVNLDAKTEMTLKTPVGDNGMTLDNDDKVIAVDHKMSAIVRLDPATGNVLDVIASLYNGAHFKSPNDLIMRGDGNIYFSDPAYFEGQGPTPKTANTAFYRISPAKVVSIVESTGTKDPNGVALSPDDNTLYTVVTADRVVKKWALAADGSVSGGGMTHVAQTGSTPDGMCVDCAGNLYVSTLAGLEVYSPTGTKVATLGNGKAINCSFGGADHKTLFVTNDTGAWFATVNIPGLP